MRTELKNIEQKISSNCRIDASDAVYLYKNVPLPYLGFLSDSVKRRKHGNEIITYVVDMNINYTNICVSKCRFCAFYKEKGDEGAYLSTFDQISEKIRQTISAGGTQILMQGGLHPDLDITYYENLFKDIKNHHNIHIHALSPPEILHIASNSDMEIPAVLIRLKKAGLDSIPGGGAEILSEDIRCKISPKKCSSADWLNVMRTAHKCGIRSSATMMFGHLETVEQRVEHMERLRTLQNSTGGFTAFIPWTFKPGNTEMGGKETSTIDYLKTLALSRIFLDNFDNIQASWVTQGYQVAQLTLNFGANDMGSVMMEENVVSATGTTTDILSEKKITDLIKQADFTPQKRDAFYNYLPGPG